MPARLQNGESLGRVATIPWMLVSDADITQPYPVSIESHDELLRLSFPGRGWNVSRAFAAELVARVQQPLIYGSLKKHHHFSHSSSR